MRNGGNELEESLTLDQTPLLTPNEAAEYTGSGINKLRALSNERSCNYVLFVGRKRMFKRDALVQFHEELYSV